MVVVMGDEPERAQSEEQPTIWLRGLCGAELLARRKHLCANRQALQLKLKDSRYLLQFKKLLNMRSFFGCGNGRRTIIYILPSPISPFISSNKDYINIDVCRLANYN